MKARTLSFVILFSNIYKQRHLFTFYIISNGFRKRAENVVKTCYDLLSDSAGIKRLNVLLSFCLIKKKLTTITADTGKETSVEKMNYYISLPNHPEFENPDFKRKNPGARCSSLHIKSGQTIAETTLIKTHLYE